ncbi:MAG: hypothetical protein LBL44_12260 [Treponema sp.]|jgi:hypothetical protein|nr:hypothetical protein [Treponema sp.]
MNFFDDYLDEIIRKKRRQIEKQSDPDLIEAQKILDNKFPGAEYDEAMLELIQKKKNAGRFKKWMVIVLIKFICFAGLFFWIVTGTFNFSLADYLTIAIGAVAFAVLPLRRIF